MSNNTKIINILKQIKLEYLSDKQASILLYTAFKNNMLQFTFCLDGEVENSISFDVNSDNYDKLLEHLPIVQNEIGDVNLSYGDGGISPYETCTFTELKEWLNILNTNYREASLEIFF
jgi:hypothetical protein